jgi:hypothetical protein
MSNYLVQKMVPFLLSIFTKLWEHLQKPPPRFLNVFTGMVIMSDYILKATGPPNYPMYLVAKIDSKPYLVLGRFEMAGPDFQTIIQHRTWMTRGKNVFLYAVSTKVQLKPGCQLNSLCGLNTSSGVCIHLSIRNLREKKRKQSGK